MLGSLDQDVGNVLLHTFYFNVAMTPKSHESSLMDPQAGLPFEIGIRAYNR